VSPHPTRFQATKSSHFVTFSCTHRYPLLKTPDVRTVFEEELERSRRRYRFFVFGYVVMPEHVHLLLSEPEEIALSRAIQVLKQGVSHRLRADLIRFWYPRYYDFNVHTQRKHIEKLRYIHRNPVKRELVSSPELWPWSSFRHYATGYEGIVEKNPSGLGGRGRGSALCPP
jgi:putative transposase